MKQLCLLIILFTSFTVYSQSYEHIKKLDTIYILFREAKFNTKIDFPEEKNGFKNRHYTFKENNLNETTLSFLLKQNYDKVLENRKVKKSFLKKYKKNIIEIDSVKKLDDQDIACNLFPRGKIIYILDFSERKGKGIMLYRVWYVNVCFVGE